MRKDVRATQIFCMGQGYLPDQLPDVPRGKSYRPPTIGAALTRQHTLEAYPFTAPRLEKLQEQIQSHVESMTYEHHGQLLEQSGLAPIMKTIRTRPPDTPLSRLPATAPKPLTQALSTFTSFLGTIDVYSSPRLALLSSARLSEEIHRRALAKISQAYGELCERVLDKKEGYEFAETLLRRGKDEVAVALGVHDEDGELY